MDYEEKTRFGLDGTEKYALFYESNYENASSIEWSDFADIHAGGEETSSMLKDFPNSVRKAMLPLLKDSNISWQNLGYWINNTEKAKEIVPLGYCGNPANVNIPEVEKIDNFIISSMASTIEKSYQEVIHVN